MKIRRKPAKASRSKPPLYVIGFSSPPAPEELQAWFDSQYGGPLAFKNQPMSDEPASQTTVVSHGPWTGWIQMCLPSIQAETWQDRLEWQHSVCGAVGAAPVSRSDTIDVVLHATRLARGITLLTGGTAYDLTTQAYLNPSDWSDRPLLHFHIKDQITIVHSEDDEHHREWFYTRGLSKFGVDDIEIFQSTGLPTHTMREDLIDIADELVRKGQSPNVGSTIPVPALGLSIRIVRHRTHFFSDTPLILREITW